jgi:excisionase family DNA binding protein
VTRLADALRAEALALEAMARSRREQADELDAAAVPRDEGIYITVDEAARRFEVSRRTVFEWVRDGLPSIKRGRVRRIPVTEARAWLAARQP